MNAGIQVALYNPTWKMFIKMHNNGTMGCSPTVNDGIFPNGWKSEIFEIKELKSNSIAFWSPIWKMFIKMHSNGKLGCSPVVNNGVFPDTWESEIFEIKEVMPNKFAFWNPTWKMFIKMHGNGTMGSSPISINGALPAGWESEIFEMTVIKTSIKETEEIKLEIEKNKSLEKEQGKKLIPERKEEEKKLKIEEREKEKKQKQESKEQERKIKEEEKKKEKEKKELEHKLKSSNGKTFCVYCGKEEHNIRAHPCYGRKMGHNYVFLKDKRGRLDLKCNKCGKRPYDSIGYCT